MLQIICILLATCSLVAQQRSPTFRMDATYVKVPVTVLDENQRIRSDLKREHFRLFEEGESRRIENFVLDQSPIHVLLLLDVSSSLEEELEAIQDAAWYFARSFDRRDRIAVFSFAERTELLQDWTNDARALQKSIKQLKKGYRTALYDALLNVSRDKLSSVGGKKVIILLTDGLDNQSLASFNDTIHFLIRSHISLYIVSRTRLLQPKVERSDRVQFLNQVMKNVLDEEKDFVEIYFREKEASINHLAEATGGRAFFPEKLTSLSEQYLQVAKELKTQYILTFLPPKEAQRQFRRIEVTCTQPVSRIYHRKKYWAADK